MAHARHRALRWLTTLSPAGALALAGLHQPQHRVALRTATEWVAVLPDRTHGRLDDEHPGCSASRC
jgi:hypothetical protein